MHCKEFLDGQDEGVKNWEGVYSVHLGVRMKSSYS